MPIKPNRQLCKSSSIPFYWIILPLAILFSCKEDDPENISSQYIIVNEVAGKANVSIYDFGTKKLTEQFYTATSIGNQRVLGANKSGDQLYLVTGSFPDFFLRKIDLTGGTETHSVRSWLYSIPFIDFSGTKVIVTTSGADPQTQDLFSYVKIYDENLVLQDSVVEANAIGMSSSRVVGDKLFYCVQIINQGFFLKVFDLNSNSITTSIGLQSRAIDLIGLSNNELLVIQENKFYILNTQTLQTSVEHDLIFNSKYFSLDKSERQLYFLSANSQPTATPYAIRKVDLSTGKLSLVNDVSSPQAPAVNPIVYDEKAKLIITGPLKIFSKEGELLEAVSMSNTTSYIFIK